MTTRTATARYDGVGKEGRGALSTQSGVLDGQRYGFGSRFEDGPGTNPEELLAAAHAGCFTMALAFALAGEGATGATLETVGRVTLDKDGEGFRVTRSDLHLTAAVPGLDDARVRQLAEEAKANCPLSKALNVEMTLAIDVREPAAA